MAEPILEVRNLKQHFQVNSKFTVKALDGISFTIEDGEIFALVGESGSGKSTAAKTIMGCIRLPTVRFSFMEEILRTEKGGEKTKTCCIKSCRLFFRIPQRH